MQLFSSNELKDFYTLTIIIVLVLMFWTLWDIKEELKRANDLYEQDYPASCELFVDDPEDPDGVIVD